MQTASPAMTVLLLVNRISLATELHHLKLTVYVYIFFWFSCFVIPSCRAACRYCCCYSFFFFFFWILNLKLLHLTKTWSHHCRITAASTILRYTFHWNEQWKKCTTNERTAERQRVKKENIKLPAILINLLIFITYLSAAKLELSLA